MTNISQGHAGLSDARTFGQGQREGLDQQAGGFDRDDLGRTLSDMRSSPHQQGDTATRARSQDFRARMQVALRDEHPTALDLSGAGTSILLAQADPQTGASRSSAPVSDTSEPRIAAAVQQVVRIVEQQMQSALRAGATVLHVRLPPIEGRPALSLDVALTSQALEVTIEHAAAADPQLLAAAAGDLLRSLGARLPSHRIRIHGRLVADPSALDGLSAVSALLHGDAAQ